MKRLLPFLLMATPAVLMAQATITSAEYDALKASGQLNPTVNYRIAETGDAGKQAVQTPVLRAMSTRSGCTCMQPADPTYVLALAPSDDGSSGLISLPFTFNFYGTSVNSLYINNNGNVSFGTPYSTFSASGFPSSSFTMIAPFWADVDTRGTGVVHYKLTPTHLIVKWDSVGYYSFHTDKINTFQLIITDGLDSILPAGNNVSFCYGDMQWTTGDASSGTGGFGGVPTTVGVNQGDGTHYFQVGRFDSDSTAYDGPYGLNDGVDFLDNQSIYFDVDTSINIPPVLIHTPVCDTLYLSLGDTLRSASDTVSFFIYANTPETDQIITLNVDCDVAAALTLEPLVNSATTIGYNCKFDGNIVPDGIHHVTFKATDNGTPAMSRSWQVNIVTSGNSGVVDTSNNIPPVLIHSSLSDTVFLSVGGTDTVSFFVNANTPESDQTITLDVDCDVSGALTLDPVVTSATTVGYNCTFNANLAPNGTHHIVFTAADNGTPAMSKSWQVNVVTSGNTTLSSASATNTGTPLLYPNPAGNQVTIKSNTYLREIKIIDLVGHVFASENVQGTQHTVNIGGLVNGLYFVQVTQTDGTVKSMKLLKK